MLLFLPKYLEMMISLGELQIRIFLHTALHLKLVHVCSLFQRRHKLAISNVTTAVLLKMNNRSLRVIRCTSSKSNSFWKHREFAHFLWWKNQYKGYTNLWTSCWLKDGRNICQSHLTNLIIMMPLIIKRINNLKTDPSCFWRLLMFS